MTGAELRAHRKDAELTQVDLARRAGVTRDTVQYWERKAVVNTRAVAPRRFLAALGMRGSPTPLRARGDGVLDWTQQILQQQRAHETVAPSAAPTSPPLLCGACTRKGHPCRNPPEPGRSRCKFHGGMSTGPKTPEGRARIAEAQRRRWASHRQAGRLGSGVSERS